MIFVYKPNINYLPNIIWLNRISTIRLQPWFLVSFAALQESVFLWIRDVTIVTGCIWNQGTELYLCSLLLVNQSLNYAYYS